ncbi:MAG: hypothetical protein ACYTEL_14135 [Planctomycetota bacterium]|jgi:hypothetical protein
MGHTWLPYLYKSRRWQQVIAMLDKGADTGAIASAALAAAEGGFREAAKDAGFRRTVWLLTQLTLAARKDNFPEELKKLGMAVPGKPRLFDVLGAFARNIDAYLDETKSRTDISEMGQLAAVETLSGKCLERTKSLFGTTPEDVQRSIRELSTKKNFGLFARDFFGRFTYRYLNYFLNREVPKHVGPNESLADVDAHCAFNEALAVHCKQSAVIVQEFAGGWYSKTAYETGISQDDAAVFTFVALKKLGSELKRGGEVV